MASSPGSGVRGGRYSPKAQDPNSFVLELDKHIINARHRAMRMLGGKRAFEVGNAEISNDGEPFAFVSNQLTAAEQLKDLQQNLQDLSINKIRQRIRDVLGALQRESTTPLQSPHKSNPSTPLHQDAQPASSASVDQIPKITRPLQRSDPQAVDQELNLSGGSKSKPQSQPLPGPAVSAIENAEESQDFVSSFDLDSAPQLTSQKIYPIEDNEDIADEVETMELDVVVEGNESEEQDKQELVSDGLVRFTPDASTEERTKEQEVQAKEQEEKNQKKSDALAKKREELQRMFDMFDEDGNGTLCAAELLYVYKFYGLRVDEAVVLKQLQRIKAKGSDKKHRDIYADSCDFEDFCRLIDSPMLQRKIKGLVKSSTSSALVTQDELVNEEDADNLKIDTWSHKKMVQVKQMYLKWWRGDLVFDPSSRVFIIWNMGTMLWVMQASLIIPCRLGFGTVPNTLTSALDHLSELWFIADVFLSMHMAYTDEDNGELVMDPSMVRSRYFRTWFVLDCISSIPVAFLTLIVSSMGSFNWLKIIRLVKIFRLLKMLKLKTLENLEESGVVNPSLLRFLKLLFTFLFLLHFVASGLWVVVAHTCVPCPVDQMGLDGVLVKCNPGDSMYPQFCPESWRIEAMVQHDTSLTSKYLFAFNWAILSMLGDNAYPGANEQYAFTILMSILGIAIFSSIIGSLSSMMTSMDAIANSRKEQLDAIRGFLHFRKVDKGLSMRIHGFYKYLWTSGQSNLHQKMFSELPLLLQSQLDIALKQDLIMAVPMFRSIEKSTVVALCGQLQSAISIPEQVIIGEGDPVLVMYFLVRGKVNVYLSTSQETTGLKKVGETDGGSQKSKSGRVLTKVTSLSNGSHFGEVALLEAITRPDEGAIRDEDDDGSRHTAGLKGQEVHKHSSIIAEVHCELEEFRLKDFQRMLEQYPDLSHEINKIAAKRQRRQKFLKRAVENSSPEMTPARNVPGMTPAATGIKKFGEYLSTTKAANKFKLRGNKAGGAAKTNSTKEKKLRKKSMMDGMQQAIFDNATWEPPRSMKKLKTFSVEGAQTRREKLVANKRKNTVQTA
jgi:CRP-like cAMP-binding protein